ncbi:hypothetical protein THC_0100 [Caldimicrobium thiodismutans]|uniref:Multidrug resistance protein MdtA-like barrel-sandwich hybrid domain-containing protein n=1 Tax=Caldimicrobium thiodismutans TaxID=1653476 RepID=A0A0U4W002_9BACT|nr:efflux RND transporter periplasmic adaptor subunit [Caldimicrobium thiodismutans]BAU22506.1 hypothetical protein THC_0100 [Caldimicrobium thiodismutans]
MKGLNKKKIISFIVIVFLILSGITLLLKRKREIAKIPPPQEPIYTVEGIKVQKGRVTENVQFLGKFLPVNEVSISTKLQGYIEKVFVNEGDQVKRGQLLVKIDAQPVMLAIENLRYNEVSLEHQVESLSSELQGAQSNLSYEKENFLRDKKLYEVKAIAEMQYLKSKTNYENAKARVESLIAQINSAKEKIKALKREIAQKTHDLRYLNIVSPIEGYVSNVTLREGNLAMPGATILKVESIQKKIIFTFPLKYIKDLREGSPVSVSFDGIQRAYQIHKIYPSANDNSLAVAEVLIDRAPDKFPSNSLVYIDIPLKIVDGLVVPKTALLNLTNGTFVLTLNKEGYFSKIPVKVLAQDKFLAAIEGNLTEGTPVAIGSEDKLRLLSLGKKGKFLLNKD